MNDAAAEAVRAQVEQWHRELEIELTNAVTAFESRTGLAVHSVKIDRTEVTSLSDRIRKDRVTVSAVSYVGRIS